MQISHTTHTHNAQPLDAFPLDNRPTFCYPTPSIWSDLKMKIVEMKIVGCGKWRDPARQIFPTAEAAMAAGWDGAEYCAVGWIYPNGSLAPAGWIGLSENRPD